MATDDVAITVIALAAGFVSFGMFRVVEAATDYRRAAAARMAALVRRYG